MFHAFSKPLEQNEQNYPKLILEQIAKVLESRSDYPYYP